MSLPRYYRPRYYRWDPQPSPVDQLEETKKELIALVEKLSHRIDELEREYAEMKANVDMLKGLSELEADIEAFKPP